MWPFKKKIEIEIERPVIEVQCRHTWEPLPVDKATSIDQYECEWCGATVPAMESTITTKKRCKKCGKRELEKSTNTIECLGAFIGGKEAEDNDCVCLRCYEIAPDTWKKEYGLRKGFQTYEEKLEGKDL